MSEAMTVPPLNETEAKRTPTVYFIDDSATMREVIKIAFRRENINVITCADAASALAQFEQNRPDVVITGVVNKRVADKAVAVQADELIRKPFQPQELIGRVRTLLAPKESAATQATRERANSNALQNLFSPAPPAPQSAMPTPATETTGEPAWPRALAEAFTPLLQPFSGNSVQQGQNQKGSQPIGTQQPHAPSVPQTNQTPSAMPSSREMVILRAEVARLE